MKEVMDLVEKRLGGVLKLDEAARLSAFVASGCGAFCFWLSSCGLYWTTFWWLKRPFGHSMCFL